MGNAKYKGGVGLARATAYDNEPGSPDFFVPCESAQITETPIVWQRKPNFVPDITQQDVGGFDYTWSIDGITCPVSLLGFLLWTMLGADAFSTPNHTVTPADDLPWLNVFLDMLADVDASSHPTQVLVGAKATTIKIEWAMKDWMKVSISGVACSLGTAVASLTPTIAVGDDNAACSWTDIQDGASGYVKLGLNGGSTAAIDTPQKITIELSRPAITSGVALGSNQPTNIQHGHRELKLEIEHEFNGTDPEAQYQAFAAQQLLELELRGIVSANSQYDIAIPKMRFTAPLLGGLGADDDVVKCKIMGTAERDGSTALMTATIKDAGTADYDTL